LKYGIGSPDSSEFFFKHTQLKWELVRIHLEEVSMAIISPYCMLQLVNSQSDSTTGTHEKCWTLYIWHISSL